MRDKRHVFTTPEVCSIFWTKLEQYAAAYMFELWIATLMSNHYHFVGYLHEGAQLGEMMRKLHGSVAWMTCKASGIAHKPFWRDDAHRDYFDGCLRDVVQLRRSYRYVENQAQRAGIVQDVRDYANTRAYFSLEACCRIAEERQALMSGVPYARYDARGRKRGKEVDPAK